MKIHIICFQLLLTTLISSDVIAQNVLISNSNNPNEPSIIMNPLNTDILVAGSNLRNVYNSNDGGLTWNEQLMTSDYGVWGDPSFDVDTDGNFYYFHLSNPQSGNWIDRIVCQRSTNDGNTWNAGTFTGLNGTKAQDKQWSVIDPTNNNIYLTWTQFDNYGSSSPNDKSIILFSKSTNGGQSWSTPKKINSVDGDCVDEDNTVEGATPAVGPNGEIYVAWAGPNGLVFNKSLDQGETWLDNEISINPMPTGWDYSISGISRANGLPITKCDLSDGPNNGTIYVNWSDQRNGANDTDIWLSKSTDGGNTWSIAKRVNDDSPGKQQFFTWMDIDQTNGNLFFVFYDRREHSNNLTDVFLAFSEDGGNTIANRKISESPFYPNSGVFFGDYTNLTVHNNIVRPIWTRLDNSSLSIWTDVTPFSFLSVEEIEKPSNNIVQYPNPAKEESFVSFKLHEESVINLSIFDTTGKEVHVILNNETKGYGKYVIPIELDSLNLQNGTYYCKLSINGISKTLKMIVIE